MAIDPIAVGNMFARNIPQPMSPQDMSQNMNVLGALKAQADEQKLAEVLRSNPNMADAAAAAAAAGVDPKTTLALRDQARQDEAQGQQRKDWKLKNALGAISLSDKAAALKNDVPTLTPETYPEWRARAQEVDALHRDLYGTGLGSDKIPEQWDEKWVGEQAAKLNGLRTKEVTLADGTKTTVAIDNKGNPKELRGPNAPKTPVTYGKPYVDGEGRTVQDGSNGRVQVLDKPGKDGGHDPAAVKEAKFLMAAHPGMNEADAYNIVKLGRVNPIAAAVDLTKARFGGMPVSKEEFDAAFKESLDTVNKIRGEQMGGAAPKPAAGPPPGAPTATNPKTGQKVYFDGTAWKPY